ncbi:MAG: TfpX/TfpZ family type IV pilin accessory protein [Caldimonas sp.]
MTSADTASPLQRLRNLGWRDRLAAAGIHLGLSLTIAALAAILVFVVWYPGAFRELAGGRDLFVLLTSVDVVLGPLLTLAVFNRRKSRSHLRLDLAVVGALQLAALVYGLHTVFIVRPVAMIFEVDRFRLVTANDVAVDELPKAPPAYRELPLTGPLLLGARQPEAGAESNDALFQALAGKDVGVRPLFWQPYEQARSRALERARPIALLLAHYPQRAADIRDRLKGMGADESTARFMPVMARGDWSAVLDAAGDVRGYLPLDGFI